MIEETIEVNEDSTIEMIEEEENLKIEETAETMKEENDVKVNGQIWMKTTWMAT